jgi:hypothetical protein
MLLNSRNCNNQISSSRRNVNLASLLSNNSPDVSSSDEQDDENNNLEFSLTNQSLEQQQEVSQKTSNSISTKAPVNANGSRDPSIIDRLRTLYLNESLADVFFLVGVGATNDTNNEEASNCILFSTQSDFKERIPAHKLILSIGKYYE